MHSLRYLRYDVKQIIRDPTTVLLMFTPLILILSIKPLLLLAQRYIYPFFHINLLEYNIYISSVIFQLIPGMLGTVIGFMMLDDKDGRIYELMSITPLGREGYFYNRIIFPSLILILYSFITYFVLNISCLSIIQLIVITILLIIQAIIISLILFDIADDKVKGLTYAKLINAGMIFALSDLFNSKVLSSLSFLFPQYWFTKIIRDFNIYNITIVMSLHILWLVILFNRFLNNKNQA